MLKKILRFELISRFKFQSILLKTLLLLLLLMLFTIGGVYFIFSNLVTEQHKGVSRSAQQLHLTAVSNAMESALIRATNTMDAVFSNQSVTGLLISPTRSDYDRLVHVMDEVSMLPEANELIRQSWLYVYGSDMVYSSDGLMNPILESDEKKLIITCVTDRGQASAITLDSISFKLLEQDGRLFLFQVYPHARPLGILICEINSELLYSRTADASGSSYFVYAYEQNQHPIFPQLIPYSFDLINQSDASGFFSEEQQEFTLYQYRSPNTGFSYLSSASSADLIPPFSSIIHSAFPYLLVVCILVFALSVYLIWAVYKPIQDVIYSMIIPDQTEDIAAMGNEFDFIRATYQDSADKNEALSGLLSEVAPAVVDRVFHSLMSDTPLGVKEVESMLESIGSPYPIDGRYLILLFQMTGTRESQTPSIDMEIHTSLLLKFSNNFWSERARCHSMRLSNQQCVSILCFSEEASKAQIKFSLANFRDMIQKHSEDLRYNWAVGAGQLCIGLIGIHESALTAREDLSRQLYFHSNKEDEALWGQKDSGLGTPYFTSRSRQLIYETLEGKYTDASNYLPLISEVARNSSGASQAQTLYQQMHSIIVEEMVKLHIDPSDMSSDLTSIYQSQSDLETVFAAMKRFCEEAFGLIRDAGQKGQNKHVDNAKKYISTHYTDKGLSLDEVSRHVGISSPYLSKIFSQSVGVGFLDYLNQYRIEKAKQLLGATGLQVAEIGYQVGFQSSQSFTRVFKRLMGNTPSQYRDYIKHSPLEGKGGFDGE